MTLQPKQRPTWPSYFIQFAKLTASRSTCIRRAVGAVLVKENHILATGYNGPPRKVSHCAEKGCIREQKNIPSGERSELCRGLHGEQNALIQAARVGVSVKSAVLYCTNKPCSTCAKMLINAGITEVFYLEDYNDPLGEELFKEAGILLHKISLE